MKIIICCSGDENRKTILDKTSMIILENIEQEKERKMLKIKNMDIDYDIDDWPIMIFKDEKPWGPPLKIMKAIQSKFIPSVKGNRKEIKSRKRMDRMNRKGRK